MKEESKVMFLYATFVSSKFGIVFFFYFFIVVRTTTNSFNLIAFRITNIKSKISISISYTKSIYPFLLLDLEFPDYFLYYFNTISVFYRPSFFSANLNLPFFNYSLIRLLIFLIIFNFYIFFVNIF